MSSWPEVLKLLMSRENLSDDDARFAMETILAGEARDAQIAAFGVLLRSKGETAEELAALVGVMREVGEGLDVDRNCIDTCGTGGDRSGSVNISTAAALVVAGAGVTVVKHGNRAASSQTGSADVLSALGVEIELSPDAVKRCVEEVGMGFCFAPLFHPAVRHAVPARKALGVPTTFNFLGPLANPARPKFQTVGVSDLAMAPVMANALGILGTERAWVFGAEDGLDEISIFAVTNVWELNEGKVSNFQIDPAAYGFSGGASTDISGGTAGENAELITAMLDGKEGAVADVVSLNAAAALVVCGAAPDVLAGLEMARTSISEGKAKAVLEKLILVSNAVKEDS